MLNKLLSLKDKHRATLGATGATLEKSEAEKTPKDKGRKKKAKK